MTHVARSPETISAPPLGVNVARRLSATAALMGDATAIAVPRGRQATGRRKYDTCTFRQLDEDSNRLASGLREWGVAPGTRLALLVRPSREFISLVFALFKAGAVTVLIDPGMGRRNLIQCLADAEPEGFVAIPLVQAIRTVLGRRFPRARFNVTVGRRLFWDGLSLDELRQRGSREPFCHDTAADDAAAIIFTTGSTGPPKGVLYCHGNFDRQVTELGDFYAIRPGEIDLPGFPLFGLFNCALGVTTVIPDMDPTRPAKVDPRKIVEAIHDWQVTQAFGSPAIWNRVGQYCQARSIQLPSLRRVLSAGAPVPPHVLARMKSCIAADGDVHTPYGATEALPIASIAASEVLGETQYRWAQGAGTCIGRRFPGIDWKIIEIVDGPVENLSAAVELPGGEIGELIVSGPVVTRQYVTRTESNALGKITDGSRIWHRMGDVGYLDAAGRFWFCGRLAHRVRTAAGVMYTIPCEAIFNQHPDIYRSALVGVGQTPRQRPVIVAEPWPGRMPRGAAARRKLLTELAELAQGNGLTVGIRDFLLHRSLPVDIRHNAKIFREKLAVWAAPKVEVAPMFALVTGAGGFLGQYLVEQLLARGDRVRTLARSRYPALERLGVESVCADLRDRQATKDACAGVDVVFHAAGVAGIWGPWEHYYGINYVGTQNVIQGCREHRVPRLIYTSSPSVTFDGTSQEGVDESVPYPQHWLCHYPHTKALAERARALGANGDELLTCALRPHLIWGPRDRHLIPRLIARARAGSLRRVGDGDNRVDMVYVENAAAAHLQAADALQHGAPVAGSVYFISQGEAVNCWGWIDEILNLTGLPPVKRSISLPLAWRVGATLETLYRVLGRTSEPRMTRFLAAQLGTSHYFNIGRARHDFGYEPQISTAEGMRRLGAAIGRAPK